MGLSASQGGF